MSRAPVLLSYRTLGLGDLLTAVPALRGLRAAFPRHEHVLAAPAWLAPIVELVVAVDRHLPVAELDPLPTALGPVDVAVNLHGAGPESHRVLASTRPRRLIAHHHPERPETFGAPSWREDQHEVERWCRLLSAHGIRADALALGLDPPNGTEPPGVGGATVVHPGAKTPARRWPPDRFAAVARHEAESGRDVVVTGSAEEEPLARGIATEAGLGQRAVLAGDLDLRGLAQVIGRAGRVVSGDTGVAHLATALGRPSVVLFGPTSPDTWGPPRALRDRHRPLWAGRRGDPLAATPDEGLLRLGVDEVLDELGRLDRDAGRDAPGSSAGKWRHDAWPAAWP